MTFMSRSAIERPLKAGSLEERGGEPVSAVFVPEEGTRGTVHVWFAMTIQSHNWRWRLHWSRGLSDNSAPQNNATRHLASVVAGDNPYDDVVHVFVERLPDKSE